MLKKRLMVSVAILTGVSGCVGGGSGSVDSNLVQIDAAEEATRSFAAKADGSTQDAGGALQDGETLTARKVGVIGQLLNYDTGETGPTSASVSITENAEGGHDVILNGQLLKFTAADRKVETDGSSNGYDISNSATSVFSSMLNRTGDLDDLLNSGNGYAEVLYVQTNQIVPGEPNTAAYAVIGTETKDADLKALPTATYAGKARVDIVPATGFRSLGLDRTSLRSDMTMTADFGKGEVSGSLTAITLEAPGTGTRAAVAGSLSLDKTTFDQNGFAGTVSPDATFIGNAGLQSGSGTYSGAFYGPNAEEVAGTLGFTGTEVGGSGLNGYGYFIGDKQ
jgi:hypothetical protein